MSKYNVNFKRLALLLLPTFWRKPLFAALLYSLVSPLNMLYVRFKKFRQQSIYRITHNGQVCYLRAVLNDTFDPIERRIAVVDLYDGGGFWILYKREEGNQDILPFRKAEWPALLNSRQTSDDNRCDFQINVPAALSSRIDIAYLKAIVNHYKLASRRFSTNKR